MTSVEVNAKAKVMLSFPSKGLVESIRKKYPTGSRVELVRMDDPQAPPVGTRGIVERIDDIGTIWVRWDNGSGLGVAYGADKCRIIEEGDKL